MKKIFSKLVSICFVFSLLLVVSGCAKKAPVPEVAPKADTSMSEESLPGSPGVDSYGDTGGVGEEFLAAADSTAPKTFRTTTDLSAVHFDFDKYDIRDEDQAILNRNAEWLTNNPRTFVQIEGHCDSRGTLDYNLALGDRRAQAIRSYLISLGVSASKISVISYGEERPVCFDKNEACWSQNRRGEFLISN